jgi:hypothetical protein
VQLFTNIDIDDFHIDNFKMPAEGENEGIVDDMRYDPKERIDEWTK